MTAQVTVRPLVWPARPKEPEYGVPTTAAAAISTIIAVPRLRPPPWDGVYDLDMVELIGKPAPIPL